MRRLRIGLSQRLDEMRGRNEVREALDIRWGELLWNMGFLPVPMTAGISDHNAYLTALCLDGLLLTGGGNIGVWPKRDDLTQAALKDAIKTCIPVLGVCQGMQFINVFQGGSLRPVRGHTAVRHEVTGPLKNHGLTEVNSYHDFALLNSDLGDNLEAVAWTKDGVIEALRHTRLPWLGIMWHPEREPRISYADQQLIINHFKQGS